MARKPSVHSVSRDPVSNKVQGQDRHPRLSSDFTRKYTHKHIHGHTLYISAHTSHTPKMNISKHFIYKKNFIIITVLKEFKHFCESIKYVEPQIPTMLLMPRDC